MVAFRKKNADQNITARRVMQRFCHSSQQSHNHCCDNKMADNELLGQDSDQH